MEQESAKAPSKQVFGLRALIASVLIGIAATAIIASPFVFLNFSRTETNIVTKTYMRIVEAKTSSATLTILSGQNQTQTQLVTVPSTTISTTSATFSSTTLTSATIIVTSRYSMTATITATITSTQVITATSFSTGASTSVTSPSNMYSIVEQKCSSCTYKSYPTDWTQLKEVSSGTDRFWWQGTPVPLACLNTATVTASETGGTVLVNGSYLNVTTTGRSTPIISFTVSSPVGAYAASTTINTSGMWADSIETYDFEVYCYLDVNYLSVNGAINPQAVLIASLKFSVAK